MTGTGTSGDPFTVATPADLDLVRNDLGATGDLTYYIQTADIDMSGFGNFSKIGTDVVGAYVDYDGQGFEIKGLSITDATGDPQVGMFAQLVEGDIRELSYVDCELTINSSGSTVDRFGICAGFLAGSATANSVSAKNCTVNVNTGSRAGAVFGSMSGTATNCYASGCTINAADGTERFGGFVGQMFFGSTADKCWASTAISTTGTVTLVGGFCGSASSGADQLNCFWDTDIGPATNAGDATGKTTAELQTLDTYTDTVNTVGLTEAYDMVLLSNYTGTQTWKISEGQYPILGFESYDTLTPSVTFKDATGTAISGAVVQFFTIDSFDAKTPAITNLTAVGGEYTTDVNGVATYDPNTDPAVDGTKVYGAIALDATAGDTEMEPVIGVSIGRQNVDLTLPA